jgi:hypothetical protein
MGLVQRRNTKDHTTSFRVVKYPILFGDWGKLADWECGSLKNCFRKEKPVRSWYLPYIDLYFDDIDLQFDDIDLHFDGKGGRVAQQ